MTSCSEFFKLTIHLLFLFALNVIEEFEYKSLEYIGKSVTEKKEDKYPT